MKWSSYQCVLLVVHVVIMSHFVCLLSASCDMPDPVANTTFTVHDPSLSTGSYIIWECSNGYRMDGEINTVVWVCLQNGSWLGHSPECTDIKCPSPAMAAYSMLEPVFPEVFVVNQTVTYTCSSNQYTLIGDSSNTCLQDGTWENDPPICQRTCGTKNTARYSDLTCYRRRASKNWGESYDLCESKKETLATVKDAETQQLLVREFGDNNDIWIGAMEGLDWKWKQSDEYIERFFWPVAFPVANQGNCIGLLYQDGEFTWTPRSTEDNIGVLCQFNESCQRTGLNQSDMVLDYIDNCYQFLDVSMSWANGVTECEGRGGFLAEILDDSTNTLLTDQALHLRDNSIVEEDIAWWIGGYDDDTNNERSWYWSDKTRMIYDAWNQGEPDNNNHDCVEMRNEYQYKWNDRSCDSNGRTLCQIGIPACGDPGQPMHGSHLPGDRTTYSVGATLQFTCDEGYILTGAPILTCMNNGTWDQLTPSCEAVECNGTPPMVALATMTTHGIVYQDITVYTCQEGYIPNNEPISFCQHTSVWSTPIFNCTALSACYCNPCMNGGTCSDDGSSYTCTCPPSYTGLLCYEEIPLTTPAYIMTSQLTALASTTRLPTQRTEILTAIPNVSSPSIAAIAAGGTVVILLILVAIVATTVLYTRRHPAKPIQPIDVNEMDNYDAVANSYVDSQPINGSYPPSSHRTTPSHNHPMADNHDETYYVTVEEDESRNGGLGAAVVMEPSTHLKSKDKKQSSIIKDSNDWKEMNTEDGLVDNVLYGTSDEQPSDLSSLYATPNKVRHAMEAKRNNTSLSHPSPEQYKTSNLISNVPNNDENVYEGYEEDETMVDNELYGVATLPTPRDDKIDKVIDEQNEEIYENPDEDIYANEESMTDDLYDRVSTQSANQVNDDGHGDLYQNNEFHAVPNNLVNNELYNSVDEI